jgi:uncharacterized HAD superfamily protein
VEWIENMKYRACQKDLAIAVDIDGVLAQTPEWIVEEASQLGISLQLSELCTYRLEDNPLLIASEARRLLEAFWERGVREVAPTKSAQEVLSRLRSLGELHIVTSRSENLTDNTRLWLETHRLTCDGLRFSMRSDKKDLVGEYDFLIDDDLSACEQYALNGSVAFLIDRPWNSAPVNPAISHLVRRISSLEQAVPEMQRLLLDPARE